MTPHRIIFWQIEGVWIFYVFAGLATGLFLAGIAVHIRVWKKNVGSLEVLFSGYALKRTILDIFLGRRVLHGDITAGMMHFFLFWGFFSLFIGTALLSIHGYLFSFLEGATYLFYSLAMEVGGLMVLTGILWALIRRYIQRVPRLEMRLEDALVPTWLLLVGLSGFIVEGLRLTSQQPQWGEWSFVGWQMGLLFSVATAKDLYPYLWWGHAFLSLGFIAVIPFTKLFHILGAPAGIYFQGSDKPVIMDLEQGAGEFDLRDTVFFDGCMRCGRCVEVCPSAGAGEPFAPRDFIQAMRCTLWQEHFPWGDIRFLSRGDESEVDEVIIENGKAKGIRLTDGTEVTARQLVVGDIGTPQMFNRLIEEKHKNSEMKRRLDTNLYDRGHVFWGTLALHKLPHYKAAKDNPDINATTRTYWAPNDLEFMKNKYMHEIFLLGMGSKFFCLTAPDSIWDPTRAPEGKHTVLFEEYSCPLSFFSRREWRQLAGEFLESLIQQWMKYAPNMTKDNIIGSRVITPVDLQETHLDMKDGSWCEGSMAASQSGRFRGQPGGFRTFVENLYMCSSSLVGGGGIGRGSSFNCYQAIAEDFGLPKPKH